jgi:hypothetical protein
MVCAVTAHFDYHYMADNKDIQAPDAALQEKLDEILNATPEKVTVNGHTYTIGWLHHGTERKMTHIAATEKDPHKANCKIAAAILLNGKFKILFMYWFLWRWLFYVKELDNVDVLRILDTAKKKVQHEAFFLATMYSTEMTDLMMTMTKEEVSRIQAARRGAQPTR